MVLQYFVNSSETGARIPVDIDRATDADLAATKEGWQTDWSSEFIRDPSLEKYTARTASGEIVALGAYRETDLSIFSILKATRQQSHPYPKKEISEYWPHDGCVRHPALH